MSPFDKVDFEAGRNTVQFWLDRTAWGTLNGTKWGLSPENQKPRDILFTDPLLKQVYLIDLATFIVNEKVSVECVSATLRFAPDEGVQTFMATQVLDEGRHLEVFTKRAMDVGLTEEQKNTLVARYTTPAMKKFHDLIYEQVDKADFLGATIALNVILEGLAAPVYRYETKYWSKLDPGMSELVNLAFQDEVQHIGFGENVARHFIGSGKTSRNKIQTLMADFKKLINEVFDGVVHHYIGLYQEAANEHMDAIGDIEIFPGHKMFDTTEEEQVKLLLKEVEREYTKRLMRIGLEY